MPAPYPPIMPVQICDQDGNYIGPGSGSGGGGGAVTVANGADVTQGARADAAWSGTGDSTVVAALKGIYNRVGTPTTALFTPSFPVNSTALENAHLMKSGSGSLPSISVAIGSVSGWLMLFDAITAPADGAVVPKYAAPLFSDGTQGFYEKNFISPLQFTAGMMAVFSSTGPLTLTKSATAYFSGQVL